MTDTLKNRVVDAMKAAEPQYPPRLWWDDPEITDALNEAELRGWVRRPTVTQVEWTEKGISAVFHETDLVGGEDDRVAMAEVLAGLDAAEKEAISSPSVGTSNYCDAYRDAVLRLAGIHYTPERLDELRYLTREWVRDSDRNMGFNIPGGAEGAISRMADYLNQLHHVGQHIGMNGSTGAAVANTTRIGAAQDVIRRFIDGAEDGKAFWVDLMAENAVHVDFIVEDAA